jgi:hypothetical protein
MDPGAAPERSGGRRVPTARSAPPAGVMADRASGTSVVGRPAISAQTTAEDIDTCLGVSGSPSMSSSGRRRLTPGIVAP